jgi:hypothetical protein
LVVRFTLLYCTTSILLSPTIALSAQDGPEFPDTLLFGAPVQIRHVLTLDSFGTVTAELREVQARLVVLNDAWYGRMYTLAVASGNGYDLYPILGNERLDDVQLSAADIRGNGQLQVVVRTMTYAGHTGWEHAIHEHDWAVQVWDLQERRTLLDMPTGHSHVEWTNTWVPDSTGLIPYEERTLLSSEGELSCELTEVELGPGTMTMVRTDDCPELDDHEPIPVNERVVVRYALRKDAWVKQ